MVIEAVGFNYGRLQCWFTMWYNTRPQDVYHVRCTAQDVHHVRCTTQDVHYMTYTMSGTLNIQHIRHKPHYTYVPCEMNAVKTWLTMF